MFQIQNLTFKKMGTYAPSRLDFHTGMKIPEKWGQNLNPKTRFLDTSMISCLRAFSASRNQQLIGRETSLLFQPIKIDDRSALYSKELRHFD